MSVGFVFFLLVVGAVFGGAMFLFWLLDQEPNDPYAWTDHLLGARHVRDGEYDRNFCEGCGERLIVRVDERNIKYDPITGERHSEYYAELCCRSHRAPRIYGEVVVPIDWPNAPEKAKRILNLHPGAMEMSDDFDDELWMGDDGEFKSHSATG